MKDPDQQAGTNQPQSAPDDLVLPFQAERAKASGRLVRLNMVVDTILKRHDYPDPVSKLLGEAVTLTAMLGTSLKFEGKFILQTKTDGLVNFLVVHYYAPGKIRGYASYNKDHLAEAMRDGEPAPEHILGNGHLAMTIDRGPDMERYQGIVALEGGSLSEAADAYFRQSEQLPTFIRLAIAKHYVGGEGQGGNNWSWRGGGLMLQNLTSEGGVVLSSGKDDEEEEEDIWPFINDDEDWNRACHLASTVEDHELLDPLLESERLLYRLFHEEGVRTFQPNNLEVDCRCSRERIEELLKSFSTQEIEDVTEEGQIIVTCEFCNTGYQFDAAEFS